MAVSSADVLRIAPELAAANLSAADWSGFIADASAQVNPSYWGSRVDLGVKYLAAHLVAIAHPEAGGRAVQSISAGGVSQTFVSPGNGPTSAGDLALTRFGIQFHRLRRSLGLRFMVP